MKPPVDRRCCRSIPNRQISRWYAVGPRHQVILILGEFMMSSISLWHNLLLSLQIQQFNILLPFTDIYLPLYGSLNYAIIVTFLGTKVMGTAFRTTDRYSGLEVQGCGSAGTIWYIIHISILPNLL
jgi:hypothetical protein